MKKHMKDSVFVIMVPLLTILGILTLLLISILPALIGIWINGEPTTLWGLYDIIWILVICGVLSIVVKLNEFS